MQWLKRLRILDRVGGGTVADVREDEAGVRERCRTCISNETGRVSDISFESPSLAYNPSALARERFRDTIEMVEE